MEGMAIAGQRKWPGKKLMLHVSLFINFFVVFSLFNLYGQFHITKLIHEGNRLENFELDLYLDDLNLFCPANSIKPCLCSVHLPPQHDFKGPLRINSWNSVRCAMTIHPIGRLGNLMGEYATLFALAKLNSRPAFITEEMASTLRKYFKVSLPVINTSLVKKLQALWPAAWKTIRLHDWMDPSYGNFAGLLIRLDGYPCSWTFYDHIREDILKEFTFKDDIMAKAQGKLRALRKNRETVTYVGVHVRRTDYVNLMKSLYKGVVADRGFLMNATNYFRSKYKDAIFIVVSDDLDWCVQNMDNSKGDVYFMGNKDIKDPIQDMALLSNCNHSIITIGTYGYWGAYLAGGEVIYLYNYTLPESPFLRVMKYNASYLPQWIPMKANLSIALNKARG